MENVPSRPVLAAVGVAALLLTTGCLSTVGGPGAATSTGTPTDASGPTATDAPTTTPTDSPTAPPTDSPTATGAGTEDLTATPAAEADGPESAAALEETFEDRMTSLDSLAATRTQSTSFEGGAQSSTTDIWVRFSTGEYRTEVVAPESRAGNLVVGSTDTVWVYDARENVATKLDRDRDGSTNGTATVVTQLATAFDLTGYERVTHEGQGTYRVTLVPERESGVDTTVTAWLDAETYFPVTIEQSYALENRTVSVRTHFENVTLNPAIPDERFAFDPPANATVETVDLPETETFDSLETMRESVDASVPDPAVPDGYSFEQGRLVDPGTEAGRNTTVTLRYSNGTDSLTVSKIEATFPMSGGENVTVGDREGRLRSYGDATSVTWRCDGWTYSVSGTLDRAEILAVADSVACS